MKERKEILKKSDIVSINYSLNSETEKLIGENEFNLMKNDALFINFVHGKAIDENALLKYVKNGKIRAIIEDGSLLFSTR